MDDFIRTLVGMFAVIAPLGALATVRGPWGNAPALTHRLMSPALAFAVLAVFALLGDPILDALDVSPESFQFAAAVAMFPLALRLVLAGDSMAVPDRLPSFAWAVPFAVPLLTGPSSIIAVISYAARFGEVEAILASAAVCALTAAIFAGLDRFERVPLVALQSAARLSGGLIVVIAVELAIDGVRSV